MAAKLLSIHYFEKYIELLVNQNILIIFKWVLLEEVRIYVDNT